MLNFKKFWNLRLMFPELTEAQFQVLMLYAFGADNKSIADMLGSSVVSVKKTLQRIKQDLCIAELNAARLIYHTRALTAMMAPDNFPKEYYKAANKNMDCTHL